MATINYARNASVYDKRHADIAPRIIYDILAIAQAAPGMAVLDMAAGTGRVSVPLSEAGLRVTACDIADKMLGEIASKTDTDIKTVVGSADALPFDDDSFPLVALARALYLIPNWQGAIAEMARVLKPGGYFIHEWGSGEPGTTIVRLRERLRARLLDMGVVDIFHPGARCEADVITELLTHGFDEIGAVKVETGMVMSLQDFIDKIAGRECSYLWGVSEPIAERAIAELTEWAKSELGALDQSVNVPSETYWRVYHRS